MSTTSSFEMTDKTDFGTIGRFVETPVEKMGAETKSAYDYMLELRGVVPGPHRIWLANPRLLRTLMTYDVPSDAVGLDQTR
jgi:4-carboxymuconolactone decarboxylase